jgi:transcriptional regulator with XRE-family HTH domain
MSIASRIKAVRLSQELSLRKFASKLDVSSPTISRLENGQRTPDVTLILRIVEIFGCSLVWLMTGISEDAGTTPVSLCRVPIFREIPADLSKPPLESIEDWLSLPKVPSTAAAIYCHDDSASPLLKKGDLVLFVPEECRAGDLALLVDQWGEANVRRVRSGGSGLTYYAENPEYRDRDKRAEFKPVGKVIKVVRDLT